VYKHTQIGYASIIIATAVVIGIIARAIFQRGVGFDWTVHAIVGVLIVAIAALFSSLTIHVAGGQLSWHFAIPTIRNSILLSDIARVDVVRNPIIYGWGMHMIRGGWVYNVSGRSAVEVTLKVGTRVRLGSDEPDALLRAITQKGIASSGIQGTDPHAAKFLPVTF